MKALEVKEINLVPTDFYNANSYKTDGLYIVHDETLVVIVPILVYVKNHCVLYVGDCSGLNFIETKEKLEIKANPKSNGSVSEELFLKAMSLMVNKDESYKN
tara:strand:+ start:4058 stop:4363 length:306 start_codon:yes stop_codon:yes gene_type:complete